MTYLIAAVGSSGAGKTTGLLYLASLRGGQYVYLGQTVLDGVQERSLQQTPENERLVRLALREQHGPAALVKLNADKIVGYLKRDVSVLLDAIFSPEELDSVRALAQAVPICLVSIIASFDLRYERLKVRPKRSTTELDLRERDKTELEKLRIDKVMSEASHTIANDSSLEVFHQRLSE